MPMFSRSTDGVTLARLSSMGLLGSQGRNSASVSAPVVGSACESTSDSAVQPGAGNVRQSASHGVALASIRGWQVIRRDGSQRSLVTLNGRVVELLEPVEMLSGLAECLLHSTVCSRDLVAPFPEKR